MDLSIHAICLVFSEEKRQAVHILLLVFAFSLKYLTRFWAVLLLLALLGIMIFLIPKIRLKNYFYRYSENKYSEGAVLYFLVLLILVLIFPLSVVAASWAILALGDGAATLVGKNFKVKELPWNRQKSYAGILAFMVFGTVGAYILLKWMMPELNNALTISFKTALIAAIVESLPFKINDNLTVAITSAIVLSFLI